ncbi:hypothetical protein [Mycetohabitans sp. B6]|nr:MULTISPECIES: hypothetical protein [Mycetohabitans]
MESWIHPVTLSGQAIVLELLSLDYVDALEEAVTDRRLWEWWALRGCTDA